MRVHALLLVVGVAAAAAAAAAVVMPASLARAAKLYASPAGMNCQGIPANETSTATCSTLTAALSAAGPGDTIMLSDGKYAADELVLSTNDVSLLAVNTGAPSVGADTTTEEQAAGTLSVKFDGSGGTGSCLLVATQRATVRGVRFMNCNKTAVEQQQPGGGGGSGSGSGPHGLTLENVLIGPATTGIKVGPGNFNGQHTFSQLAVWGALDRGLWLLDGATESATLRNVLFYGCNDATPVSLTSGAGAAIKWRGALDVDNAAFVANRGATGHGGAVFTWTGHFRCARCHFARNSAVSAPGSLQQHGGALYLATGGTATLDRCTFDTNTARGNGGAVFALGAVTASDSQFRHNAAAATGGRGGALYTSAAVALNGVRFYNNTATDGAAAYLQRSDFANVPSAPSTLDNTEFLLNDATSTATVPIEAGGENVNGAALALRRFSATLTNATFNCNTASKSAMSALAIDVAWTKDTTLTAHTLALAGAPATAAVDYACSVGSSGSVTIGDGSNAFDTVCDGSKQGELTPCAPATTTTPVPLTTTTAAGGGSTGNIGGGNSTSGSNGGVGTGTGGGSATTTAANGAACAAKTGDCAACIATAGCQHCSATAFGATIKVCVPTCASGQTREVTCGAPAALAVSAVTLLAALVVALLA